MTTPNQNNSPDLQSSSVLQYISQVVDALNDDFDEEYPHHLIKHIPGSPQAPGGCIEPLTQRTQALGRLHRFPRRFLQQFDWLYQRP